MSNSNVQENKMGIMPIPKLLISMSLPMIASMLVQALYNIVDSMFVAQLNEGALTAVSLVFPVQNLMIAVASGTGVGINALLSRSLGEKKLDQANKIASNGVFLALISSLVFAVIGIFCSRLFFAAQTTDAQIVEYGTQYMSIITIASIGIFLQVTYERLLQSTGKTFFNMITQGTGAIINIILDPILIFGWFGLPAMGVTGAALATVIGQFCASILAVYFHNKHNAEIIVRARGFKIDKETIVSIYKIGVPSILMQSIGSVTTFCMNNILLMFSATAATVFGVYFKLQSFIFMPLFGLTNGMIPIVAYNYGAKNRKRILATVRFSCAMAVTIMAVGMVLMWIMPETMLRLFDASEDMMSLGVPALKIISTTFIMAGVSINLGSVFQALGKSYYSMIVSFARQIVVLLPAALLLSKTGEVTNVWFAFPIAEFMSLMVTLASFIFVYKSIIAKISRDNQA